MRLRVVPAHDGLRWAVMRSLRLLSAGLIGLAVLSSISSCSTDGVFALSCGDGRVDDPEECDEADENGLPGHCSASCTLPKLAEIEGDVLAFMNEVDGARVSGATVSILELPERSVVTGDDAHFRFEGIQVGTKVTLVVEHPNFKTTQSATVVVGPNGIDPFSVQVVPKTLFAALSGLVPLPVEEESHCIIASTVARTGGSLYVHLRQGAAGASVSLEPAPAPESGPIYFNEAVLPDTEQPTTSKDGGVLFYRLDPGEYVMSATRDDTVFNHVTLNCRAGIVVNAGPPLGLLANVASPDYGAGAERPADSYSDATDALCAATRACVNADAGSEHYPEITEASCAAMFRNVWASIEGDCDEESGVKDAARSLYDCRAASCALTLGGDEACVDEEASFEAAQTTYGACLEASAP